jgi:hypothetical protein
MDPKEIELDSVKCVDFDHDRNNSGLFVDVERILRVRQNIGIFLTS